MEHITKTFYLDKEYKCSVLKDISITIDTGELIAIKGKSGAGKSTLLHIIGCLDTPTSGCYRIGETDMTKLPPKELARLRNEKFGFVMQDFGLIRDETVFENVSLPLLFSHVPFRKIAQKTDEQLERIGISHLRNKAVELLSGGEKQRVAIARALINNPDYILADEPTGSLDSSNSEMIMQIMKTLNQEGKTVIIITHDDTIANACNRIIHIKDGVIQ
ncbi:MAG: ABC transporter ATP-binding protein [Candidatus Fimivicinus sp.]|nr:ABC transporter ATP-binding protein [Oscillospiraceae bacterium]MDY5591192.1 ABC transporter ATP-binding protein [Candidatus Fimivicinus sp.]